MMSKLLIFFNKLYITIVFLLLLTITVDAQFYGNEKKYKKFNTITNKKTPKKEEVKDTIKTVKEHILHRPLDYLHVTSLYGRRFHPVTNKYKHHNGIDLRGRNDIVYSMTKGVVSELGYNEYLGIYVKIKTKDYTFIYGHLSEFYHPIDKEVKAGDIIAKTGKTGRVTGPHLHLSIKYKNKYIDPKNVLDLVLNYEDDKTKVFEH